MGNLESDWEFSKATLARALKPGYFALRICAVDLKNSPQAAATLGKIKQSLALAQTSVEKDDIKVKPLRAGSTSEQSQICGDREI